MSASKTRSFRLGHDISDAADLRAKQIGYKSSTGYIKGLIRYDILCQSSHGITTLWDLLTAEEQDQLEAKLLARALSRQGMTAKEAATVDWKTL